MLQTPNGSNGDITKLLFDWSQGNQEAGDLLFEAIYDDLRKMVGKRLSGDALGHGLQTKEIIHETYLRLVEQKAQWENRGHFFAIAATVIRRVMVDHARQHLRQKRGGNAVKVNLEDAEFAVSSSLDWLALDEALDHLAKKQPLGVKICEMHYFAGLTFEEIAEIQGIGRATAVRQWKITRAYLKQYLDSGLKG